MKSQPLFVVGAPRSGTTFFCHVLNQHPLVGLTNECRIFLLLKDMIEGRSLRPDLLDAGLQQRFVSFAKRNAGRWIERFYRESLGIDQPIWGDKHPSYGDPAALSGRWAGVMTEPRSGSCLRLIRDCLPDARFIHLHRHPWHVATSLLRRGWVASTAIGLQVWRQHVGEIEAFFAELDGAHGLTISYAELLEEPVEISAEVGRFLGLRNVWPIAGFLIRQRARRTPFSSPTSDLSELLELDWSGEVDTAAFGPIAEVAHRLGYSPTVARPQRNTAQFRLASD